MLKRIVMNRWLGILLLTLPLFTAAQGSGDAGMWSSGDFDSRSRLTDTPTRLYVFQKAGMSNQDVICLSSEFQFDWNVWGGINFWFAIPYQVSLGDLTSTNGIGDFRVVLSHTLAEAGDFVVKINVGGVIPSGNAKDEFEGKPLPMVYQSSQGAASFLVSSMFYFRHWNLSVGYQRYISASKNSFTKQSWDMDERVEEFPDSPGLWNGDDLSFRLRKDFDRPKAQYSLSVLPAFRLSEDRIQVDGKTLKVDGSDGFSLNVTAGVELRMGKAGYFHFLAAVPVIQREVYPDGLNRVFMVMAGFGVQLPD